MASDFKFENKSYTARILSLRFNLSAGPSAQAQRKSFLFDCECKIQITSSPQRTTTTQHDEKTTQGVYYVISTDFIPAGLDPEAAVRLD